MALFLVLLITGCGLDLDSKIYSLQDIERFQKRFSFVACDRVNIQACGQFLDAATADSRLEIALMRAKASGYRIYLVNYWETKVLDNKQIQLNIDNMHVQNKKEEIIKIFSVSPN